MFQFPSFPTHDYVFIICWPSITSAALPHLRDLWVNACLTALQSLSQLYHVFHRVCTPNHPPCTLIMLDFFNYCARFFDYTSNLIVNEQLSLMTLVVVEVRGLEPLTYALQRRRSPSWAIPPLIDEWWAKEDLNLWPPAYQADALTNWATGPKSYPD